MTHFDEDQIFCNARMDVATIAAVVNHALNAVESLTALNVAHSQQLIQQAKQRSTQNFFGIYNPEAIHPMVDQMMGYTQKVLEISGGCSIDVIELFQARLHDIDRSLDHLHDKKSDFALYGGEGAVAAVRNTIRSANNALELYKQQLVPDSDMTKPLPKPSQKTRSKR